MACCFYAAFLFGRLYQASGDEKRHRRLLKDRQEITEWYDEWHAQRNKPID
jgi:hypothetical protein